MAGFQMSTEGEFAFMSRAVQLVPIDLKKDKSECRIGNDVFLT
jgi:hypothetical protein